MTNNYYVYVHRKLSDNSIFYIGKGCNGRCTSTNSRNKDWWSVVFEEKGFKPSIYLDNLSEKEAFIIEDYLIKDFGYDNLTNMRTIDGIGRLKISEIEYEKNTLTKNFILEKTKEKPTKDYSFLEEYFEVEETSFELTKDIKETSKLILEKHTNLLASMGLFSPIPASKIAQYFKLNKPKVKRVKGKTVQVVEGLKIKNI